MGRRARRMLEGKGLKLHVEGSAIERRVLLSVQSESGWRRKVKLTEIQKQERQEVEEIYAG